MIAVRFSRHEAAADYLRGLALRDNSAVAA
jgi:hypothetical protein